ncbi:MAG: hypothetical protein LBF01_02145, partial [Bacteroidales bacterium]|nr:hypothetical protein [Bacteroidales bacterium]
PYIITELLFDTKESIEFLSDFYAKNQNKVFYANIIIDLEYNEDTVYTFTINKYSSAITLADSKPVIVHIYLHGTGYSYINKVYSPFTSPYSMDGIIKASIPKLRAAVVSSSPYANLKKNVIFKKITIKGYIYS